MLDDTDESGIGSIDAGAVSVPAAADSPRSPTNSEVPSSMTRSMLTGRSSSAFARSSPGSPTSSLGLMHHRGSTTTNGRRLIRPNIERQKARLVLNASPDPSLPEDDDDSFFDNSLDADDDAEFQGEAQPRNAFPWNFDRMPSKRKKKKKEKDAETAIRDAIHRQREEDDAAEEAKAKRNKSINLPVSMQHVRSVLKSAILKESFHDGSLASVPHDKHLALENSSAIIQGSDRLGCKQSLLDVHINNTILSVMGLQESTVTRAHEMLLVYSLGFHELITDVRKATAEPHQADIVAKVAKLFSYLLKECSDDGVDYEMELSRVESIYWSKFKHLLTEREVSLAALMSDERKLLDEVKAINFTLKKMQMEKQQQDERRLGVTDELHFQHGEIQKEEAEIAALESATAKLKGQFTLAKERHCMVWEDMRVTQNLICEARDRIKNKAVQLKDDIKFTHEKEAWNQELYQAIYSLNERLGGINDRLTHLNGTLQLKLAQRGSVRDQIGPLQQLHGAYTKHALNLIAKQARLSAAIDSVRGVSLRWDDVEHDSDKELSGVLAQLTQKQALAEQCLQKKVDQRAQINSLQAASRDLVKNLETDEDFEAKEEQERQKTRELLESTKAQYETIHAQLTDIKGKITDLSKKNEEMKTAVQDTDAAIIEKGRAIEDTKKNIEKAIHQKEIELTETAAIKIDLNECIENRKKIATEHTGLTEEAAQLLKEEKKQSEKYWTQLRALEEQIVHTTTTIAKLTEAWNAAEAKRLEIEARTALTITAESELRYHIELETTELTKAYQRFGSATAHYEQLLAHNATIKQELGRILAEETGKLTEYTEFTAKMKVEITESVRRSGELIAKKTAHAMLHRMTMKKAKQQQGLLETKCREQQFRHNQEFDKIEVTMQGKGKEQEKQQTLLTDVVAHNETMRNESMRWDEQTYKMNKLIEELTIRATEKTEDNQLGWIRVKKVNKEAATENAKFSSRKDEIKDMQKRQRALLRDLQDIEDYEFDLDNAHAAGSHSQETQTVWSKRHQASQTSLSLISGKIVKVGQVHA